MGFIPELCVLVFLRFFKLPYNQIDDIGGNDVVTLILK